MVKANKKRKQKTPRQKLEAKLDKLILKKMRERYGDVCQLTGRQASDCGRFHILSKGAYPRLEYHPENLLWVSWFRAHYPFHHNYYKARDEIVPMIVALKGADYEDQLIELSRRQPKMSTERLEYWIDYWSSEWEKDERSLNAGGSNI